MILASISLFISTLLMVSSVNPQYAVLFLILTFLNASLYLIYLGVDYIGVLIIIIYVGAVSVLFLFVVMMLNIKKLQSDIYSVLLVLTVSTFTFVFMFISSIFSSFKTTLDSAVPSVEFRDWEYHILLDSTYNHFNLSRIGYLLFNQFSPYLILSALILLLAMIGSILLTNRVSSPLKLEIREQSYYRQNIKESVLKSYT